MSLSIRLLTDADLDEADVIVCEAFNSPRSRRAELAYYLKLQPAGWFLATFDEKPAGVVGAVDYGPFAYVGMMTVSLRFQRQGIGRALMDNLLAWLDRRGSPCALLDATDKGAPLYAKLGFVEDDKTALWRYTVSSTLPDPLHQPASGTITTLQAVDIPDLVVFDEHFFGAARERVLSSLLAQHPQRAFVLREESGDISGYLIALEGSIGPWVARTATTAEALLRHALALPFLDNAATVNVALSNEYAPNLLTHYGFTRLRVLSHMRRGHLPARDRSKLYGQVSFALG